MGRVVANPRSELVHGQIHIPQEVGASLENDHLVPKGRIVAGTAPSLPARHADHAIGPR